MSRMAGEIAVKSSPAISLTLLSLFVLLAGLASIGTAAASQALAPGHGWLAMVGLAVVVSAFGSVRIPGLKANIALGDMVSFACAAMFGPSAGVIAAAAEGAAVSLRVTKTFPKFAYNVASNSLSMAIAGFATTRAFPGFGTQPGLSKVQLLLAVGLLAFCYGAVSTLLISIYLSIWKELRFLNLWKENSIWSSISFIGSGGSAVIGCLLAEQLGYYVFVVIIALMIAISLFYRMFSGAVERASDISHRLKDLNFRTMETMMAALGAVGYAIKINVRRVVRLATELGRSAGCSSEELSAIETAALVHDIGNIAVPTEILEKPAGLTLSEFEKIRTHAEVGARIVESMGFPPAVAQIIEHHHERFDGSGYPHGLKGEHIPLGARVLTIVDTYNALTIDRPHRGRFGRKEALDIMKASAGKAFDPALLTKFLEIVIQVDEEACRLQSEATAVTDLQTDLKTRRRRWQDS
jgi:putative nucleotidyltransferase with HDIG domain